MISFSAGGPPKLWAVPADRSDWEQLTEGNAADLAPSWSPDGRFLAYVRILSGTGDILLYRFEDRQVLPFLATKANEAYPDFSPDGRWLAYASDESGRFEIYVTSFPDGKETHTVSRQGGTAPAWSRDGRRLFYYSGAPGPDGRHSMMAVSLGHDPGLSMGTPEALFRLPSQGGGGYPMRTYALHPDGRFLVGHIEAPGPIPPSPAST